MIKLLKVGKTITSIFFLAVLLITYAFVVTDDRVFLQENSMELYKVDKLFNGVLIAFILFSLLIFIFSKILEAYFPKTSDTNWFSSGFKSNFSAWLEGMHLSVNIFFITLVLYVGFINSDKYMNLMDYSYLLYVGPVAVFFSLLSLLWVFIKK